MALSEFLKAHLTGLLNAVLHELCVSTRVCQVLFCWDDRGIPLMVSQKRMVFNSLLPRGGKLKGDALQCAAADMF